MRKTSAVECAMLYGPERCKVVSMVFRSVEMQNLRNSLASIFTQIAIKPIKDNSG